MKLKTIAAIALLSASAVGASAQRGCFQGYLGAGYQLFTRQVYQPSGFDINAGIKYFATDDLFFDLSGHLGRCAGHKTLTIDIGPVSYGSSIMKDRFEQNIVEFMVAIGPGYNIYNNGKSMLYAKVMAGYAWGDEDKDTWDAEHRRREQAGILFKKGFAAGASIGYDYHKPNRSVIWGGKIDAYYIGRRINISVCAQIGIFIGRVRFL